MARIEIEDVQGIVLRSYDELPHLALVLLTGVKRDRAREWLGTLLREVPAAEQTPQERAVHVGFTHAGLAALGVPAETLGGLSQPFRDDAVRDEHRDRTLGDVDDSCPDAWAWGGPPPKVHNGSPQQDRPEIHIALLLYAKDEALLDELRKQHEKGFEDAGLQAVTTITTVLRDDRKEHFGFRDGISQPRIANDNPPHEQFGALEKGEPANTVKAGEFLYGYHDELGEIPPGPSVAKALDPHGRLRLDAESGLPDFGRNGTYLVARQLEQKVPQFWTFMYEQGARVGQNPVRLAAKMVGRWPDGTPLVLAPENPLPGLEDEADFNYAGEGDAAGYRCPLGSHIRRANPRDALVTDDKDMSVEIVRRHRLLRRGRPYGKPVDESMDPSKMCEPLDNGGDRGLLFLAFNVHFDRQFEFVQQNWLNNPKFAGLYTDADPIAGKIEHGSTFTEQRVPVRLRIGGLESFVRVRGSGYFFMPGLQALQWLSDELQPQRGEVPTVPFERGVEHPPVEPPPAEPPTVAQLPRQVTGDVES